MELRWYGHSCFRLAGAKGFAVVTDPFDQSVGYPRPTLTANLVTISHDHFDHNHHQIVEGLPKLVNRPGEVSGSQLPSGVRIRGVASFHDEVEGHRRGPNTLFVIELDGLRVAHLGDLGHHLSEAQVANLGPVDVLLVPVGGTFTVDAKRAFDICQAVQPKIVVPMHYKTDSCRIELAPVEPFLRLCPKVERSSKNHLTLTAAAVSKLSPWKAVVLNYR